MLLCSPRGQTLRKQELRILPLSPGSWTPERCFQVQTTVSFGSNMNRGGFLLRCLDPFLQLDVFGFAQYTRRRGVGVAVSSCVPQTAQAEFPNSGCLEFATHVPAGPAAWGWIFKHFDTGLSPRTEGSGSSFVLNFANFNWPEILTVF